MEKNEKNKIVPKRDELAQSLADALNKVSKDGKVAFFLDGNDNAPTEFTDFISTGATMLDIAISNRPHGGIAAGRITEITGLEGSGKSLLCAHLLADTQARDGVAIIIDTETAVNVEFYQAIGIDMNSLIWVNADTVEKVFDLLVAGIEHIRTKYKDKNKLVTIVVDSVAAAPTQKELEADFSKDGYATDKAIIISKAMRKLTGMIAREKIAVVFTNQLRQKMNAMPFSDPWTTSGGKAIAFHASTRLRLSQTGKISDKDGNVIGVKVKADVVKNRLGPPHRKAEFEIYFNRGIDDNASWLKTMKEHDLIKQSGAWYTFVDETTGEEIKFQSKDFKAFLAEDLERKERIYQKICEALIMKYMTEIDPEEVTFTLGDGDE